MGIRETDAPAEADVGGTGAPVSADISGTGAGDGAADTAEALRLSMALTLANSTAIENGFVTKSSPPTPRAASTSSSVFLTLIKITGTSDTSRIFLHNTKPDSAPRFTSRIMIDGRFSSADFIPAE
jgi:hypothetical protein